MSPQNKKTHFGFKEVEEKEKVFDPKEVYGDAPNPTKL